jgi:hypothetical protein
MIPRALLCVVLALALAGCEGKISPDMAYCEQAASGAKIIDVRINKPRIVLEKSFVRKNGMIVGAALDVVDGSPIGEFRVYPAKGKCIITTYSDGESATYRLKTPWK